MAADEELYLNGKRVFEKRKLTLGHHDRNPLAYWQNSKHFFQQLASLAHDWVIEATQVATARFNYSLHLCDVDAFTVTKDEPLFVSLLLFADRSGESSVKSAGSAYTLV